MKRQLPNIPWEYKWKLIADDLRDRIERGDLVPRDRMTAAELLDQYDASHTTVRRALRHLQDCGLVRTTAAEGDHIRDELHTAVRALRTAERLADQRVADQRVADAIDTVEGIEQTLIREGYGWLTTLSMINQPLTIRRLEAAPLRAGTVRVR